MLNFLGTKVLLWKNIIELLSDEKREKKMGWEGGEREWEKNTIFLLYLPSYPLSQALRDSWVLPM